MEAGEVMVSLLILLPLAGSVVLLAGGRHLPARWAGLLGTLTVGGGFVLAVVAGADFLTGGGETLHVPWFDWLRPLGGAGRAAVGPALGTHGPGGDRRGVAHPPLLDRVHEGGSPLGALFSYLNLFVASMPSWSWPTGSPCCSWAGNWWACALTC